MKTTITSILLVLIIKCTILEESPHEIVQELHNSDKSHKVFLLYKNGNGTVQNSLQVKLVPYDYQLKEKETGNIFIVDKIEGLQNPIEIKWLTPDSLLIKYNNSLEIYKKKKNLNNIEIIYQLKSEDY